MAGSSSAHNASVEDHTLQHALITGASSGLGAALAHALAAPGQRLTLLGRKLERLEQVASGCRERGADAVTIIADVRDADAMQNVIEAANQEAPLDLLIANAGISGASSARGGRQEIVAVNLLGVMNTVEPVIPLMRARRSGQIAIISSLAGFRGMPPAPAYCASKGGVRLYGEALRPLLMADGVSVSVICPGFIDTPLTKANPFPMPMMMTTERAAEIILRRLAKRSARITFPWPVYWFVRALAALPPTWCDWCLRRLPLKEGS